MKKPTKTKKKDKPKTEDPIKSLQKGLVELASDVGILKDKVEALEKMHEDLPPQQPTP